jgi:hypothetical protein
LLAVDHIFEDVTLGGDMCERVVLDLAAGLEPFSVRDNKREE